MAVHARNFPQIEQLQRPVPAARSIELDSHLAAVAGTGGRLLGHDSLLLSGGQLSYRPLRPASGRELSLDFPAMITTSARLLRLLSLLQARRHWTARDLYDRLEVSGRTVRRDVERLRELGYPIHASPGLGGGYSMRAGSAMPPVLLEDDEAVAVAVALRAAAGSIAQMDEAAMGVLAKIDQVMPARLRKRASSLHSVTVSLPAALEMPAADVLMQIAGACRDQKKLTIGYADPPDASRRARSSRSASRTRADAGTWLRGTSIAKTGARFAPIASAGSSSPARTSLRASSRRTS